MHSNLQKVLKKKLNNGLTVLVRPTHQVPKVSTQIWYNVGSKDEHSGEKGIAHLIEHMIFKGTNDLSESDINVITNKLSGYCNAFTSYDYTGYLFDFPSHHWQEALPIMADCMKNCKFDQEHLNSELKAVIQELKMYKDDYVSNLLEDMICAMFPGHPYQHPIIGYKHDLWNLSRDSLVNFYKKHYVPNNATLVVVGDVEPEEVFNLAEKYFGSIEPNINYKKEEYNVVKDFVARSVVLYRDVVQPMVVMGYQVPGIKEDLDYAIDILSWILAQGRSSRLYKKIVDEMELASDIGAFSYDLFDQGIFFINFSPINPQDIDKIIEIVKNEIEDLIKNGPKEQELQRAIKKVETSYFSLLENNQKQAYVIGKTYVATGNENYLFDYLDFKNSDLKEKINDILKRYFSSSLVNIGKVLPLQEKDKSIWTDIQKISDQEDAKVLSGKIRTSLVESPNRANSIEVKQQNIFDFPKYKSLILKNGLEVLYFDNKNLPKIDILLDLKAKHYFDPSGLNGLGNFAMDMLLEGTKNYTEIELAEKIENLGMDLDVAPGYISMRMLSDDFSLGMDLLKEVLTEPVFDKKNINKVKNQIITDIKEYWDEPSSFVGQVARENIYKDHQYSKNSLGTVDTVGKVARQDLLDYYNKFISPSGAYLSIVGDLSGIDLESVLNQTIGKWQGPDISDLTFNNINNISSNEVNYFINRDQIVLAYAGLSVPRTHPDYDKLLLFDQIFSGGVLGSMSSRLFQLREQSGLFYTIGGSLISKADKQPGMSFIKTIVSIDRLKEAEELIENCINNAYKTLDAQELIQAKNALSNSLIDNFSTNRQIASSFLFLKKYNLSNDYFDKRSLDLNKIPASDVLKSVENNLNTKNMIKFKIGRI